MKNLCQLQAQKLQPLATEMSIKLVTICDGLEDVRSGDGFCCSQVGVEALFLLERFIQLGV